jgi:hypothetical protein
MARVNIVIQAKRKAKMEKAAAEMDRLAEKFGKWDGVKIIRHFRESRATRKRSKA